MPEHDGTSTHHSTTAAGSNESPEDGDTKLENTPTKPGQSSGQEKDEFGLPIRPSRKIPQFDDAQADEAPAVPPKDSQIKEQSSKPAQNVATDGKSPEKIHDRRESVVSFKSANGDALNQDEKGKAPASEQDGEAKSPAVRQARDRSSTIMTTSTTKSWKTLPAQAQEGDGHAVSEWSHQQLAPVAATDDVPDQEDEWQTMPAYAPFDIYNDDGKIIAREADVSDDEKMEYGQLGGAGKGYTRVQLDEDAKSATSMDDNTAYLFKDRGTDLVDEDEDARDPLAQMQATKTLLTEGQRIAYVGLTRLAIAEMYKMLESVERTRSSKKATDNARDSLTKWGQKMMVRLYSHMDIEPAEQIMIEQLQDHGVVPSDMSPALMSTARVKNPIATDSTVSSARPSMSSPRPDASRSPRPDAPISPRPDPKSGPNTPNPQVAEEPPLMSPVGVPDIQSPDDIEKEKILDIDLRWTILCDLFLVLISDSIYDSRSRVLLERVGSFLGVSWIEICQFEKRVTDALEMQESSDKENWNEDDHMEKRRKMAQRRRLAMMGLATVSGGLVIGLSAGLLAPLIGAGLAAGFTTIGVGGTSAFLAGAGGAAIITTTGVVTGGTIGVRASHRRTGAVKTFEYRPLHNNKKVNLIVSVAGWMNGKVDDIRLPYSTVDSVMGDIYSVYWEPEMLQSMGQTINILATEALTQGLQQVLGSTILISLMAALQLPIVLTKLSYLIDNPWTVSLARAELAGLILADSLIDRNLGTRPITLVGFSLGARVIFSALRELANKGAYGLIQNAYLFGSPLVADKSEYLKAQSVVSGRFVNGYCTNDWVLGYLFRATSGGIRRVAGLAPVLVDGIENHDFTELVPGHMAYRTAMPRLLRKVGWEVTSDEFAEIEDPDPDNHEKRQRELITEIEEARKDIEEGKKGKWRFGLFKRKRMAEKKEWETYDDRLRDGMDSKAAADIVEKEGGVMFDIDAIRAEVAQIAAEGMEIKQLETTLPPMKLNIEPRDTSKLSPEIGNSRSNESLTPQVPMPAGVGTGLGLSDADLGKSHKSQPPSHLSSRSASYNRSPSPSLQKPPSRQSSRAASPAARVMEVSPRASAADNDLASPPSYNAWADEDEFKETEGDVSMTFE